MLTFHPEKVVQWLSQPWRNGMPETAVTGISHDTRTLESGNLYVALRGDRFDGHDFLPQAFERGASAALVDEQCEWTRHPVLRVPDTLAGLQDLARGYRREWTGTVVGITGSVGKTTVKEMCAAVLSGIGAVHRTAGNYNNHIGLPLSMLRMPDDALFGVFEIGMNRPGEIEPLSGLLQPQIGIITDIGSAHRENFDSLEGIAREKSRMAGQVDSSGMVILDAGCEWHDLMRQAASARVVTIALGGTADYSGFPAADGTLMVNGFNYPMPLPGEHMMRNALRAIALGLELGMAPASIAEGLGRFELPPMRWETSEIRGVEFINDAYNANPLSMRANLKTFSELPGSGARWAVVGGMLELGDTADREHAALGRFIDTLGLDGVIVAGEAGQAIASHAVEHCFQALDPADAAQILKDHLKPGDRVLLKASRGVRLEQVLECFKEI